MGRFLLPLSIFIVIAGFLAFGLNLNPRDVPSPLVGKPAPAFNLTQLAAEAPFSPEQMKGKVWLLNVWASWCVSCRAEHPILVEFSKKAQVPLIGLNYKEVRGDSDIERPADPKAELVLSRQRAQAWLDKHGNPYSLTVMDVDGAVGINYGVYGVPETYVIDKAGVIRMKHTGPITPESLKEKVLPLIAELNK